MTITYDEFIEQYKPEPNLADETGGSFDGLLFPVDSALARRIAKPEHVWTLTTGAEDGRDFIQSGIHAVNRNGYFITLVPFTEEIEVMI